MARVAEREELQQLIRLMVKRIDWMPEGEHQVQYYLPEWAAHKDRFATIIKSDSPNWIRTSNPPINSRMLHR